MSNKHHFKGNSSSIDAVDYHDDTGTMVLHFSSGSCYHYPDCPKDHYHNIKKANSAGSYFHSNVRKYKAIKVK